MPPIHRLLAPFADFRHIKRFSKALEVILPQLESLGATDVSVVVEKYSEEMGAFRRFLKGVDVENTDQSMIISVRIADIESEVVVSMINSGWLLPLELYFNLQVPLEYDIACAKSALGRKWTSDPVNKNLTDQLNAVMPKVRFIHVWDGLAVKILVCYEFTASEEGFALLGMRTGFKQGLFDKPKIKIEPYYTAAARAQEIFESVLE